MSGQPLRFWWLGVSALLICVGSVGPWAKVLFVTANGLDGDGWLTLIVGLAMLGFLAVYVRSDRRPRTAWPLVLIFVIAGLAAAIGVNDWSDIEGVADASVGEENPLDISVSVGWGLVLVTLASFSAALAAVVVFLRRADEPGPTRPQQPAIEPETPS